PRFSCKDEPAGEFACKVAETMPIPMPDLTPVAVSVPDEPYTLSIDQDRDLLYVGHLKGDIAHPSTGGVSLFDVRAANQGIAPRFLGPSQSFFGPDVNGLFGITSLTQHNGLVYATSRYGNSALGLVTGTNPPSDLSNPDCTMT